MIVISETAVSEGLMRLTTQAHLEADPEAGLHDLTHRLVGQMGPNGGQQQSPQDLKQGVISSAKKRNYNGEIQINSTLELAI